MAASTPSVTDWLGVVLSSVAIIIGIVVAGMVARQSKQFHDENRVHSEATHARERYESLIGLSTEILDAARTIQTTTSERWAELVGITTVPTSPADDEGRIEVSRLLTILRNRAEQLMAVESLLPALSMTHQGQAVRQAVQNLRVEAAWLVGDANNAVITFYGGPDYNETLTATGRTIIDRLVEDSVCNVNQRLLLGTVGHQAYIGTEGNNWEPAMRARVSDLLGEEDPATVDKSRTSTMAAETNMLLNTATDRFATALFVLIDNYEVARKQRTVS